MKEWIVKDTLNNKYVQELVRCKDCVNRECDGRAGMVVCGITGESHSRLFFCGYGEREEIMREIRRRSGNE